MNHFCTHCGQVQLSSLLVIIICHVSLCVVVFRSVGTSKIRKEMQSVLMPEDVQSWDPSYDSGCSRMWFFFTSTTRDCLGHLALYFMEVLGFRMNYLFLVSQSHMIQSSQAHRPTDWVGTEPASVI